MHERRHNLHRPFKRETDRLLLRADERRSAVGIAREVRLRNASPHLFRAKRLSPDRRKREEDSVSPFLEYEGYWTIVLALTSNPGSHDFQLTEDAEGEKLYEKVLKTSQQWGSDENMMYVVGATQGKAFENIRRIVPNHFLLVPGVGAQGGSLEEVCKYGMNSDCGLLVNASRAIIFADSSENFATVAGEKARDYQQQMEKELSLHKVI